MPKEATPFRSEKELRKATADWAVTRLIELWNKLPGVEPVKKLQDRKTACGRIWKALAPHEATGGAQGAHEAREAAESRKKAFPGRKRATARRGGKKEKVLALLGRRARGPVLLVNPVPAAWLAEVFRAATARFVGRAGEPPGDSTAPAWQETEKSPASRRGRAGVANSCLD